MLQHFALVRIFVAGRHPAAIGGVLLKLDDLKHPGAHSFNTYLAIVTQNWGRILTPDKPPILPASGLDAVGPDRPLSDQ